MILLRYPCAETVMEAFLHPLCMIDFCKILIQTAVIYTLKTHGFKSGI